MPVMKQLRIGSVNYDTVGSASVTQTLTSGTEIATVTIDGAATKLYAPEGGGGGSTVTVTPILTSGTQTATISVDGTSTTLYAPEGGGGQDFKLVPVILKSASNYRSTVTIPEVGPDDVVTVFSSFGDAGSFFADYGAACPYVEKNVNGAVTFRLRTNSASPLGVLVAVFSNLELQVFGQDSDIVSNRKPTAGETVTVSSHSAGADGTRTMYYCDLVTGEEVQYASCTGTTYSGSFTMPNHSVYLRTSFRGGGSND